MKKIFSILIITAVLASLSFSVKDLGDDVLQYTNEFRKSNGLEKLKSNDVLNKIARQHSEDMAKGKVKFGHVGFKNRNAKAASQIPGLGYFAENVAYGPNTAKEVVNLWKKSQGHRANLLGNYNLMGIGIAKSNDGTIYYTQVFAN